MKTNLSFFLAASLLALAYSLRAMPSPPSLNNASWVKDMAYQGQKSAEFAGKVELFYQAIEKKDWPTSYDMRTATFKQLVMREHYLKEMGNGGKILDSYKVLGGRMYGSTTGDFTAAELIMEFYSHGTHSYSCARWIKRDGKWMCDEPGLSGLLMSLRPPDWTWNSN